jgi:DNA polymerase III subunit epsilon
MNQTRKILLLILALATVTVLMAASGWALLLVALEPEAREAVTDIIFSRWYAPVAGLLLPFGFVLGTGYLLNRYVLQRLSRLSDDLLLMRTSNPGFRLAPSPVPVINLISSRINQMFENLVSVNDSLDERVRQTSALMQRDKSTLETLVSRLVSGVVICTPDGQILLFNHAAELLLARRSDNGDVSVPGIGRSIFGFLPDDVLRPGLAELAATSHPEGTAASNGEVRFKTELRPGVVVSVHASALSSDEGEVRGYLLIVRDAAGQPFRPEDQWELATIAPRPVFYDFDLFAVKPSADLAATPLNELTFTIFDTETTGLYPSAGDEIVSIGGVRIVNGRLQENDPFDELVHPGRPIPAESTAIHGIGNQDVAGKPDIITVLPRFARFAEGSVLVGHNVAFDMRFLRIKENRCGVRFDQPVLDTFLLSSILNEHQESHGLDALAARLGITFDGRHTAYGDALVTARIFLVLMEMAGEAGFRTLGEVLEACRKSPYADLEY